MESYVLFDHRPVIDFFIRSPEQDESPQLLHQQAPLPSFRDIIPPYLHTAIEPQTTTVFENHSDSLTPTSQILSATSRSIATSPAQSQSSSMPSLTEGFDEVNVRGTDAMFSAQTQTVGGLDRGSNWMSAPQYQTMATGFGQPSHRVPQLNSQQVTSRSSPSLPPLRDINQRSDRVTGYDQSYGTTGTQMGHVPQLATYQQMYSTPQSATTDLDSSSYSRRMPYTDTHYTTYASTYPQSTRPYQTPDYSRYTTTTYEPYRYTPSYRATYGDMNYPTHAMVGSQPTGFGVPTDMSGAHPRRRRGNLPKQVTDILRAWFHDHLDHPYPTEEDKQEFIHKTGLTISQISNWFINARRRHWPALRQNRDRIRNSNLRRTSEGSSV